MTAMTQRSSLIYRLAMAAILLAFVVILYGAYTRLKDAGLGCPDWPGCYGFLTVPQSEQAIEIANSAFPERPVEADKAWPEMVHRYLASGLGLLIVIMAGAAWYLRRSEPQYPVKLASLLVVLVIFQGLLGMWTVTLKLHPLVVMGHLLGGFAVLSCLGIMALANRPQQMSLSMVVAQKHATLAMMAMVAVVIQVALGGWTSANYAALICTDLPICNDGWTGRLDFIEGFQLWGMNAENYEFGIKSTAAMTAIHVTHRIGAVIVAGIVGWLAIKLMREYDSLMLRRMGTWLLLVLAVQLGLGITNIVGDLPLAVAVAHNGVAALLLLTLVGCNYALKWQYSRSV